MEAWFQRTIVDTGRLTLFAFFAAFIVAFVLTRLSVRLIRADVRWWFKNVEAGGLHIHHAVMGVILMLAGGVASFMIPDLHSAPDVAAAIVFGIGSALVLDEFALILHLSDVYWAEAGRTSIDAVFVAVALTGLLLLGAHPVGFEELGVPEKDGLALDRSVLVAGYATTLVFDLGLAAVTLLKGKIWTGLIGLFVPVLLVAGAVRVARPLSPWARSRYGAGSRRELRALRREERYRRPVIQAKIAVQEFVGGRPDT